MNKRTIADDAKDALELYRLGLPIDAILHRHPVSYFSQHVASVWRSSLEDECYRAMVESIDRMEIYALFFESDQKMLEEGNQEIYAKSSGNISAIYLSNKADRPDFGLTLKETAKTIRVFLNHPLSIKAVRDRVEIRLRFRIKFADKNGNKELETGWVEKMREVQKVVEEVFVSP